jgi:hypothetical protein
MSSTMMLSFRVLPDGTLVPGTTSGVFQLADGAPQTLSAPLNLPGSPGYRFIFWVADFRVFPAQESGGVPEPQQTVNFNAPAAQAFDATAWYLPHAGGGIGVKAWAFSVNQGTTLPDSPFGSVVPASAQQDANTVSTAAGPVVMTAVDLVAGFGRLSSWLQFSGNGTVNGAALTVPADGASEAIAIYAIPVPDPCQEIRDQLEYLSPGDFQTPGEFERARSYFKEQLLECEKAPRRKEGSSDPCPGHPRAANPFHGARIPRGKAH